VTVRFYRAGSPAFAFAVVGGLFLWLVPTVLPPIVGELRGAALYALAVQVALTLLLLAAIDDFQDVRVPSAWRVTQSGFAVRRTVPRVYRTRALPALFLSFGVAVTVSAFVIALVDEGPGHGYVHGTLVIRFSELVMTGVLLVTALAQLWRFGNGYFGWCIGFAAGVACAEMRYSAGNVPESTFLGWAGYAAGLCLLGGVVAGVLAFRRRTREG
jgi:hypothetical protein